MFERFNETSSRSGEYLEIEKMTIRQLSTFYTKYYEKIQKSMIIERLMDTELFPKLSENQKKDFLDVCYKKYLKTDYHSMSDDFYDNNVIGLLGDYMKNLEEEYYFTDNQIIDFINSNAVEVCYKIIEGDYDDFFNIMDKNWMWEETSDLTIEDFRDSNLSESDMNEINHILKEEELIHITNEGEILSGDYDDYNEFKRNLVDECLEEIILGTDKISHKQLLYFIGDLMEKETERIAVMSGNYYFCIVDKSLVQTELKNTNLTVQVKDCIYKIKKATTHLGSSDIDRLMDNHQELKLTEYRVVEKQELEL